MPPIILTLEWRPGHQAQVQDHTARWVDMQLSAAGSERLQRHEQFVERADSIIVQNAHQADIRRRSDSVEQRRDEKSMIQLAHRATRNWSRPRVELPIGNVLNL